jgi:DNA-binding SARP family transcriptional activator
MTFAIVISSFGHYNIQCLLAIAWQILVVMDVRVYLTGRVGVEVNGGLVVDEGDFRGKQDRLVFAFLASERSRPVGAEELAEALWPDASAAVWKSGLSPIVSRLRSLARPARLALDPISISSNSGGYQLHLASDSWVDVEAAACALDEAEGALRTGNMRRAWGPALVAVTIARREFLPGIEGEWVDSQRSKIQRQLLRALECLCRVWLWNTEFALAVEAGTQLVALDAFREASHQLLMRAHAANGNRAEAVKLYHRLRALLADELGAAPGPDTETLYLELLA